MTLKEALKQLTALGSEKVRAQNARSGAGDNQFGVSLGEIRALAKKIKTDQALALALGDTGNVDAQFLAALLIEPKKLAAAELDRLVRSIAFVRVADWLNSYVVAKHPEKEQLRAVWMTDDDRWAARSGWHLTAERVAKDPDGLDLPALLDRIEAELADAVPEVPWTMNNTLAAIAIGDAIGLYRDWPVSKGCTPPFVPIWVKLRGSSAALTNLRQANPRTPWRGPPGSAPPSSTSNAVPPSSSSGRMGRSPSRGRDRASSWSCRRPRSWWTLRSRPAACSAGPNSARRIPGPSRPTALTSSSSAKWLPTIAWS